MQINMKYVQVLAVFTSLVMFSNAKVTTCLWCERVFISPVVAEGVTGLVSRIGTVAAGCRSATTSQWTPQSIYSSLTTEGGKNKQLPFIYFSIEILTFHNKTQLL